MQHSSAFLRRTAAMLAAGGLFVLAGCGAAGRDAAGGAAPLPTLTLIPPTATPTPTPVPPTLSPTPETGISASTFGQATAAPAEDAPADPVAASLAALAQRLLAEELDLPQRRIRITEITPYTWRDSSLGCPQPDQAYAQVISNGYRIVLEAGDREYIYHSDVDRVILCPAELEQLIIDPPTPRPETTAPAVPPQAVG